MRGSGEKGDSMDKKEFGLFASALRTYYPKEQILPNAQAMELWFRELQDIPYNVAETALRKWVSTNKWSPSIAEIREMTANVVNGDQITWAESWRKLKQAVGKYGLGRQKEAMESFDPITRLCVERFGYRDFCMSDESNEMADRAHFQRIFETIAKRDKENQQMALPLRETIGQIQAQNGLVRLGGMLDEKTGCQD